MKRILSIDGGGIKGVVPAAFLAQIEEGIGQPVSRYFDLIAGTSTGGIIAVGLGLGLSATQILDFYKSDGPKIFGGNRWLRRARRVYRAKYDHRALQESLTAVLGSRLLGDSRARLVIPSLNLMTGEVYIYKTAHHERFATDYKVPAVDVAMATASAPTFFPAYWGASRVPLIDGGMWTNNPTGMAVVEGLGCLGWPKDEVQVLSLGCTTPPLSLRAGRLRSPGMIYWGRKSVDLFLRGQSSGSLGTAYVLLSHAQVERVSPSVPTNEFALDRAKDIPELEALGRSDGRYKAPLLRDKFFTTPAEPFNPFHILSASASTTEAGGSDGTL